MKEIIQFLFSKFGFKVARMNSTHGLWDVRPEFLELYENIRENTLVKIDRCFMIYQLALLSKKLPGAAAELGVYKGGTAKLIAEVFKDASRPIYLFDTFRGLPGVEFQNSSDDRAVFKDIDISYIKKYLENYPNVIFKPGVFPNTAKGLEQESFCFVYLDGDLYESTRDGLEFFYSRLVPGGVIVVDDYGSRYWPGVKKTVDEFSKKTGVATIITANVQCALFKNF